MIPSGAAADLANCSGEMTNPVLLLLHTTNSPAGILGRFSKHLRARLFDSKWLCSRLTGQLRYQDLSKFGRPILYFFYVVASC
jgi:hypothetical protein